MSQQTPFAATVPDDLTADARYAPPQAHVEAVQPEAAASPPVWFSVSPFKLVVMCTFTLQLYTLYWLYKQWSPAGAREQVRLWPAARAIFGVFFIWPLLKRVRTSGAGIGASLNAGALAVAWIVFTLAWKLPDPAWLAAMAAPLFMIPVQATMNAVNDVLAPGHERNDKFTAANWVAIVLGGVLLALAVIGTFVTAPI